ncbi:DUF4190 domain-containing protein [Glaciihabitans sp. dw_435]|uniref:DUF4190 domain-containing protein n=1 Tax=Glaciihabitans sp. dw_435 TaxID=2720081 RepID=UPI001BD440A3|nr:DUF4190 domain-containing protein [Glaciihabitans sp. dw_435]
MTTTDNGGPAAGAPHAPLPPADPAFAQPALQPRPAPALSPARTLGILSLIGGIASIVFGQTVLIPVAAIVLGFLARQREPYSRAYANWGIALGIIALFGWVAVLILGALIAVPFAIFHWL